MNEKHIMVNTLVYLSFATLAFSSSIYHSLQLIRNNKKTKFFNPNNNPHHKKWKKG
jgi:hypothetical protein